MALADLLAAGTVPGPRPPRPADGVDEVARLRASVRQLEHALSSRVIVEQAIGVLSERWRVAPRDAFEQLRRVTRSHGLRIHDLARQVIASSTDPDVVLPSELAPVRPAAGAAADQGPGPDGRGVRPARRDPEPAGRRERRTRRDRPGPDSSNMPGGGPRAVAAGMASGMPVNAPVPRSPQETPARAER